MNLVKLKNQCGLVPVSVPCYDWKEESGEHVKKTVIIAPIRIIESEDGGARLYNRQNLGVRDLS